MIPRLSQHIAPPTSSVAHTWCFCNSVRGQGCIKSEMDRSSRHGTQALQLGSLTWVDDLLDDVVAVTRYLDLEQDLSRDSRVAVDVQEDRRVIGCEDDVEEGCAKL